MTEHEWQTACNTEKMIKFLDGRASPRKFRLFAVACCRRLWDFLDEDHARPALEAAVRCADGELAVRDLWELWQSKERSLDQKFYDRIAQTSGAPLHAVGQALSAIGQTMGEAGWLHVTNCVRSAASAKAIFQLKDRDLRLEFPDDGEVVAPFAVAEMQEQVVLLKEVFGDPFHSVPADAPWVTPTVVALSKGIYEDRGFDRLPILADALEDAGCDSADMIAHCRQPSQHVLGCWVVDLLSGKS
jgi:hypothetical protein